MTLKDAPATPDRLRQDQVFADSLAKVQAAQKPADKEPRSARDEEPENEESAQDRQADDAEGRDERPDPAELPAGIKERLKRAGLDAENLPPEVAAALAKVHKSMESDHGRKSQEIAKARKEHETSLAEYTTWKRTIDRYKSFPASKRKAIDHLFNEDDEPAGAEPAESPEDKDLEDFLSEFDDDGRKVAKRHLEIAEKRATRAADKKVRELQERLDRLEQNTQQRTQAEATRDAEAELDAFNEAHPEYEALDNETKELFEDAFEAHAKRANANGRRASLDDFYKRFFGVIDQRASTQAKQQVRTLADRSARAPVQSPGIAGASRPRPKDLSNGHRSVFSEMARKKGLRV
jgi:hypothetical protein